MLEVGIVGALGYGGGELLRLLSRHPEVTIRVATSETSAGKPIASGLPGLSRQVGDLQFTAYGDGADLKACAVVFLAQENGKAMQVVPDLLDAGCKVVDLSADFRFRNTATYEAWYKGPHACPEWNERAVYGLPELLKDSIQKAQVIGNPGCYATASILGLAPLVKKGMVQPGSLIVDAKSGVSGAGRAKFSLEYHFAEINESVSAYNVAGKHRHTPEIEAVLSAEAGSDLLLSFTPHLIAMTRGILATCYASLNSDITEAELRGIYQDFYADAPFVVVLDEGLPATKHTLGSNRCHIGIAIDKRMNRVTVVSCIDNLIKGAAGQAIQNMNLMCGFAETAGLDDIGGLWP